MALLLVVCVAVNVTTMVILFWMSYITCSVHVMLLNQTHPQAVGGRTLVDRAHTTSSGSSCMFSASSTAKGLLYGVSCDARKVCTMLRHVLFSCFNYTAKAGLILVYGMRWFLTSSDRYEHDCTFDS
jgi:hypothetical protein